MTHDHKKRHFVLVDLVCAIHDYNFRILFKHLLNMLVHEEQSTHALGRLIQLNLRVSVVAIQGLQQGLSRSVRAQSSQSKLRFGIVDVLLSDQAVGICFMNTHIDLLRALVLRKTFSQID